MKKINFLSQKKSTAKPMSLGIIICSIILLSSCFNRELVPKKSFKLDIGFKENEVGLFFNSETLSQDNINIFYRSGFYYITDPKNKKILKVTENGFNVLTIYNPETNPHFKETNPASFNMEKNEKEEIAYVKNFKEYPLHFPGLITVDIEKNVYVTDTLSNFKNADNNFIQKLIILKFDNKGTFLNIIGNELSDIKPFSCITKISTDNQNNLIILEKAQESLYNIYKIAPNGTLLKTSKISGDILPLSSKEKEAGYKADIIDIIASYSENDFLVTIQFIKEGEEVFSKTLTLKSYETLYQKIFKYSLKSEKFSKQVLKINPKSVNISKVDKKSAAGQLFGDKTTITKPIENLFGTDSRNYLYLAHPEIPMGDIKDYKKRFYIYDGRGHLKKEFVIKFPNNIQYASEFYVSPEGKAYYFYVENGVLQFASFNY